MDAAGFSGVRFARQDEAGAIYDILMLLHEENGLFMLDETKTRQTIADLLTPPKGIVGVIDGPKGLDGLIGLYVTEWWYTRQPHITEFFTFVKKEARRSTHAKRLIEFAKWVSDGLGLPLHIGIITTHRSEAKQRLYRRLLPQVGGYFLYNGQGSRLASEIAQTPVDDDSEKLLDAYHGAAKRLILLKSGRQSKRRKHELEIAMRGIEQVYQKAQVAMNGAGS